MDKKSIPLFGITYLADNHCRGKHHAHQLGTQNLGISKG